MPKNWKSYQKPFKKEANPLHNSEKPCTKLPYRTEPSSPGNGGPADAKENPRNVHSGPQDYI